VNEFQPSFTAITAAAARAAHLIVDDPPVIFADTLAAAVLGGLAGQLTDYHRGQPAHPILSAARAQVLCRSRFAEGRVARTAARQYVVLGAGLDTFAYRSAAAAGLRVFEVDHPATQGWKRTALAAAKIEPPGFLRYVPADLVTDSLAGALRAGGLDFTEPAIISWLGVTMYLGEDAIRATLAALSGLAPGSELIADHMLPAGLRDQAGDFYVEQIMPAAAQRGEAWRTFLACEQMAALLSEYGFTVTGHIRQADSIPAPLWARTDSLAPIALSMITTAMLSPEAIPGRR
jgi:methyltransferase (TIGR00027 family)